MAVTTPDMCRVTVVTPNRWADLALPAGEPLADLLPALLDHVGDLDLDGRPLALQRLGSPPLDENRSLFGNGVVDGETLYLNTTDQSMPVLEFDDAIAGLGAGIEALANRWKPVYTRRMLLSSAVLALALAWLVLALRGSAASGAVLTLGVSLLLVLGAAMASRSWNDKGLALVLGAASLPFGALAGVLGLRGLGVVEVLSAATGLSAAAAVFAIASLADLAVGGLSVGFGGAAFAAALVGLGSGVGLFARWDTADTVALIFVLAVVSSELLVTIACRLAGVWLPPLPRNAEELEAGIEPVPAQAALTRAAQVDQYLTALLWGSAVVIVPSCLLLAGEGTWAVLLVLAGGVTTLLRLRVFYGHWQRAALLTAGAAGPAAVLCLGGAFARPGISLEVSLGLVALGALLAAAAVVLPGRRALPHYGRAAEIFEGVVAATLLPLLLAVLGAYSAARNIR
jgi:type VII secretion integral membrane protein EccD